MNNARLTTHQTSSASLSHSSLYSLVFSVVLRLFVSILSLTVRLQASNLQRPARSCSRKQLFNLHHTLSSASVYSHSSIFIPVAVGSIFGIDCILLHKHRRVGFN